MATCVRSARQVLHVSTYIWPCAPPRHTHLVAQLWVIGLEFSRGFRKTNNDGIDSTANNAHHDSGEKETNQKSQTVVPNH
jgi:hypothetical protein